MSKNIKAHSRLSHDKIYNNAIELGLKDPAGLLWRIQSAQCAGPGGLKKFVKLMWRFVEPARPFVEGWHIDAICEHLEAVTAGQITRLLINVPPGHAKAVSKNTMVLARRGRVRLGDINVGDEVLTHRGRFRRVLAMHDQGMLETLIITTESGRRVQAEHDHPFLTPRGWIKAGELRLWENVAAVVSTEETGNNLVTAEEARLLGYLVGDGSLTHSPSFVNADEDVLFDFEKCAEVCGFSTLRREPPPSQKKKNAIYTTVGLRGALSWLEKHNLRGESSYTKRIPSAVLSSGHEVIANFLGAYWSCDGTIRVRHTGARGSIYIASCTTVGQDLAGDIQHALLRIGIDSRIRRRTAKLETKRQPGGTYVSYDVLSCNWAEVVKFGELPGLCIRKRLACNFLPWQRFMQGPLFEDRIIEIVESGKADCRCLTVEEDSSFTANDIAVHNSLLTNVLWPAYEWGPKNMPTMRYMCISYSQDLTIRDNTRFRWIITSDDYMARWPHIQPSKEQFSLIKVGNTLTGFKLATSTGGVGTGERADRLILDDPNSVRDVESDKVRDATNQYFSEVLPTRLNDPKRTAIVVIQQRTHEEDVSGVILSKDLGYEHLCLPARYDSTRHCVTSIGWQDPRGLDEVGNQVDNDGLLLWPAMYPEEELSKLESALGPYAASGQLMQLPVPRGGAIFDREWWQPWPIGDDAKIIFPPCDYVIASVDTAFTEKQENDYSAMTVWGVWRDDGNSFIAPRYVDDPTEMQRVSQDLRPKVMLMYGWQKRLSLHGPPDDRPYDVSAEEWASPYWRKERQKSWGLVEWVVDTARRYKIDRLLIETQAAGHTLDQELRRLHNTGEWAVELISAKGDKRARAISIQHIFSNGLVHVPTYSDGRLPGWAETIVTQFSSFPRTRHKDIVDSGTHALQHLRNIGMLLRRDEFDEQFVEDLRYRRSPKPLYEV